MYNRLLQNIAIIGRGNVASHLKIWLNKIGCNAQIYNPHTLEGLNPKADLYILAVTDSAVKEVAIKVEAVLSDTDSIIVHTAGSVPLDLLKNLRLKYGVLYPMQTFTKGRNLEYQNIPVFVEGKTQEVSDILMQLAHRMTSTAQIVDSSTRAHIHLGAVFACNYVNYLLLLAERSIDDYGLKLDIYKPLIQETLSKALEYNPFDSQTGPARRCDFSTLKSHLKLLEGHPYMTLTYRILSQQILNLYKK